MHSRLFHVKLASRKGTQRGVALVTALLLMLLLAGLSLAMVVSANTDMMVTGYHRNYRGSFYAAESGLSIARQSAMDQLLASVDPNFAVTSQPIPPGSETTVATSINRTSGSGYNYLQPVGTGAATSSYPEQFQITSFAWGPNAPSCTVQPSTEGTCTAHTTKVTAFNYTYPYAMTAIGKSGGSGQVTLTDKGQYIINLQVNFNPGKNSFAGYGMFIDQWNICSGGDLVPGKLTGPTFTNGAWTFGTTGQYNFTDPVGSVSSTAGYDFGGNNCQSVAGTSSKSGGTTIAPNFQGGLNLGQPAIPLPKDTFSQQRAVLDGIGDPSKGAVTSTEMKAALNDVKGKAYNGNAGVYLPYTPAGVDAQGNAFPASFKGGGIYVEGNATITMQPGANGAQIYTIVQGGTTTTVTITNNVDANTGLPLNDGSGTTVISQGNFTQVIPAVPRQIDGGTNTIVADATMLYVNGNATISGPGEGQAAIQNGTQLTITAVNNIVITGDIAYKTPPIDKTTDTAIAGNNTNQALGLFTANGDIQLNITQLNSSGKYDGVVELDASLATLCDPSAGTCTGSGGLVNVGAQIQNLDIVGGRIQNQIKSINAVQRNVYFDRRFGPSFAPPWFPSTTVTVGSVTPAGTTPSIIRTGWMNQTSTY